MLSGFQLRSHALMKRSFVGVAFSFILCFLLLTILLSGTICAADDIHDVDVAESLGVTEQVEFVTVPQLGPNANSDMNEQLGLKYLDIQDTDKTGILKVNTPSDLSDHYCVTTQKEGNYDRYVYKFNVDEYPTFTLLDGPGTYEIHFFSHVKDTATKYVRIETAYVTLDEGGIGMNVYLTATHSVPITEKEKAIATDLTKNAQSRAERIRTIQRYVADNFYYDYVKAYTIKRGYRCDPDEILETGSSICTDYATVMTGMLRSIGIPSRMVWGYVNGQYHAWVEAELNGYWVRYDPTMFDGYHCSYSKTVKAMKYVSTRRY